ncbi:Low molecular weight protein-tyrosine-phosphatase wzb [Tatumella ptyseos]|uniref:Low molecular weight protein-tyrosine-phosphatase wzb n=1 Tax=Tatumella ptyseos TaxID=82987 RepID=A0A2X5P2Q9_9GAMM|nr:Low molecular weight protein-tyrosine-phosphatase wzb [Tatumella ptyseos]
MGALADHAADASAIAVSEKHGLSLDGHKGQQFTGKLGRQYDLILVMEKHHIEQVTKIARKPAARLCCLVTGWGIKRSRIRIARVWKRLNLSISYWTSPRQNGPASWAVNFRKLLHVFFFNE